MTESECPLLRDITDEQRAKVTAASRDVTFEPGASIIEEGRVAGHCWVIRTGQVELQTRMPNGRTSTVQTLGRGDLLGWSWLLPPYRWRFDAVANSRVEAVQIDADALRALAEEDPRLGYQIAVRLVETLADRLHATRARLIDMYGNPRAH